MQKNSQSIKHPSKIFRINKLQQILNSGQVFNYVRQFANNLLEGKRIISKISQKDIDVINDKSFFQDQNENRYTFLYNLIKNLESKLPVFLPYNKVRVTWDIIQAILIIVTLFIYSLITFFQMHNNIQIFSMVIMLVFIIDTILNFNTAFLSKGNVITVRREITIKYFKNNFLCDLMAFFSLYKNFTAEYNSVQSIDILGIIMNLMIYFKIFSFFEIMGRINAYFIFSEQQKNILDLLKLFATLLTIMHVFGCIWHFVALFEIQILNNDDTWLHAKQLQNDPNLYSHYIYSVYFLAVTMISIGYGDITPQNPIEVTVALLIMFTTGLTFAYSINAIGNILQNIKEKRQKVQEDLEIVNQLMIRENINNELKMRISNYIVHIHTEQNMAQREKELDVIKKLSQSLQNEIKYEISCKFIKNIDFIINYFSQNTIQQTINIMEECGYNAGDVIFKQQDSDDFSLYQVVSGEVKVFIQNQEINNKTYLQTLYPKQTFGQYEFFTGGIRSVSVCAATYTRLFKINQQKFIEILKQNKNDFETFCEIKEKLIHQKAHQIINSNCYQCQQKEHFAQNCPKIHIIPDKQQVLKKYLYTQSQERAINERKKNKKYFHSLKDIQSIQLDVIDIIDSDSMYDVIEDLTKNLSDRSDMSQNSIINIQIEDEQQQSQKSIINTSQELFSQNLLLQNQQEKKSSIVLKTNNTKDSIVQSQTSIIQEEINEDSQIIIRSLKDIKKDISLQTIQSCNSLIEDQPQAITHQSSLDKINTLNQKRQKSKKSTFLIQEQRQSVTPQVAEKIKQNLAKIQTINQFDKTKSIKRSQTIQKEDQLQQKENKENQQINDTMKEYILFFPHNNIRNILEQYKFSKIPKELRQLNSEIAKNKKKTIKNIVETDEKNKNIIEKKFSFKTTTKKSFNQTRQSVRQSLNFSLNNSKGSQCKFIQPSINSIQLDNKISQQSIKNLFNLSKN